MTKERELLRRALEDWDFSDKFETLDPIFEEIRTYLSNPSDDAEEPIGRIVSNASGQIYLEGRFGGYFDMPQYLGADLFLHPAPKRKPLSLGEIAAKWQLEDSLSVPARYECFEAGVRFAEKHHGIGGGDE